MIMNRNTRSNIALPSMRRVGGSISLLLLVSAGGLEFFAQRTLGQTSVATLLLVLYLASWSYVLGLVGLLLSLVSWVVSWRRVRVKRADMSRYSPAEPRSRRLEQPELESPQFLQQGVAPVVPTRSSTGSDDENEATSINRVA